jgi:hypothetical protein
MSKKSSKWGKRGKTLTRDNKDSSFSPFLAGKLGGEKILISFISTMVERNLDIQEVVRRVVAYLNNSMHSVSITSNQFYVCHRGN